MGVARSTVIPNYIKASSPQGLRRLMLLNNKKLGAWHKYEIMFVNGAWYAWYHADISANETELKSISESLSSGKEGES